MTVNYRRTSLDRDTTFYIPKVECFACYDSGIVANGDGFVNQFIPDYDRDQKGRLCGGQDLAIICHCKAAYGDSQSDNERERVGFRDSYGNIRTADSIRGEPQPLGFSLEKERVGFRDSYGNIRTTDSIRGEPQALGCSLEKDKIRQIHVQRKDAWQKSAKDINETRQKIAKGEKYETPYYIQVVKEELTKVGDMFSFPSEKAIVQTMTESNDQN